MRRLSRRLRILVATASMAAGFVDAIGFRALGGFFVSFMSGNTTRMGVGIATHAHDARVAGGLIATFVTGVVIGSLWGNRAGRHRRSAVLGMVAVLLASAAILHHTSLVVPSFVAMALAMGAENAIFERDGKVQVGLTYMTGTLVKTGQHLATALEGGDRWGWTPYLLQWLSLAGGAVAGALCYPYAGMDSLWLPVAMLGLFALPVYRVPELGSPDA